MGIFPKEVSPGDIDIDGGCSIRHWGVFFVGTWAPVCAFPEAIAIRTLRLQS
jgi:hypothetical protein